MKSKFLQRRITIQLSFSVNQILLVLMVVLGIAYLVWEFYWYQKVGYNFIKWHTRIIFTALLTAGMLLPLIIFVRLFIKDEPFKKVVSVSFGIWFGLIIYEAALGFTDVNRSYSEIRTGYYRSPFDPEPSNLYHVYHANQTIKNTAPEFSFSNSYNSLGYLGKDWELQKSKAKRIITIGDSFTEGDGAPADSCYPAQLQHLITPTFEVLNAGVRGSDPVFGIKNMEDRLLLYKPDLVIQAVSENDVLFDFCIRGGYERFQNDSTVLFRPPPAWEPLYAISNLCRMFLNFLEMDIGNPCGDPNNPSLIKDRNEILKEVFDRYEKLGVKHNFKTVILFYPTKSELLQNKYSFDFNPSKNYIKSLSHVSSIDILPVYYNKLKHRNQKVEDVFWKIDGHHNAKGYNMMAECVMDELVSNNIVNYDN